MSNQPQAPGVIYVCPERDIECGRNPASWCAACPQQPQAHVADERAAFEQEMLRRDIIGDEGFDRRATGEYVDDTTEAAWESWQAARAAIPAGANVADANDSCQLPPDGWYCTRKAGHDGPCAAIEHEPDRELDADDHAAIARGMARIAAGAPAETPKPVGQKPPLPEADRLGPLGERLFLVGTLCNYGTACALAAQPAPATDARDALDAARYRWLVGNNVVNEPAIDAAMLSANSPREAG